MIFTDDLVSWLRDGLGRPDVVVAEGPNPPKRWGTASGMLVLITPAPGSGLDMEYALEGRGWQFRTFGPQSRDGRVNSANSRAERMAYTVDRFLLSRPYPCVIAGDRIARIQRFGAGPTALAPDQAGRTSFVATYVLDVPTGL